MGSIFIPINWNIIKTENCHEKLFFFLVDFYNLFYTFSKKFRKESFENCLFKAFFTKFRWFHQNMISQNAKFHEIC